MVHKHLQPLLKNIFFIQRSVDLNYAKLKKPEKFHVLVFMKIRDGGVRNEEGVELSMYLILIVC